MRGREADLDSLIVALDLTERRSVRSALLVGGRAAAVLRTGYTMRENGHSQTGAGVKPEMLKGA